MQEARGKARARDRRASASHQSNAHSRRRRTPRRILTDNNDGHSRPRCTVDSVDTWKSNEIKRLTLHSSPSHVDKVDGYISCNGGGKHAIGPSSPKQQSLLPATTRLVEKDGTSLGVKPGRWSALRVKCQTFSANCRARHMPHERWDTSGLFLLLHASPPSRVDSAA